MGKLKNESDTPNKLETDIDTFQHQTALLRYMPRVDERAIYDHCRMFYLRARQMVSADAPAPPADMMDGTVAESYLFRLREFIRGILHRGGETIGGQNDPPLKPDPLAVEEDAVLSPRNLAEKWGILPLLGALQSRLKRFRESNPAGNGTHWIEINDAKPREAKFWFRVRYVRPILDTLKATSERPAKKLLPR